MRTERTEKNDNDGAKTVAEATSRARFDGLRRRRDAVLSWLGSGFGSVVLHLALLAILFLAIRGATQTDGLKGERRTDEIGIVFSDSSNDGEPGGGESTSRTDSPANDERSDAESPDVPETLEPKTDWKNAAETFLPPEPTIGLAPETAGARSASGSASDSANRADSAANGAAGGVGGGQSVGFGDVRGKGSKFVYVLDRSDSMGYSGGAPMRRAIADAVASVESLDPKRGATKFQVVWFNHDANVFDDGKGLIEVNPANKARAVRTLRSIAPDGGTEPTAALEIALKMNPDVVFFLTDADEELSETALAQIRQERARRRVKQICVVEFGKATAPKKKSFRRLAGENGGTYVFKDVDSF